MCFIYFNFFQISSIQLWDFVAGKRISGQGWYNNYKPAQIPRNKNVGDGRDYFRAADKCFKHGSSGPLHRKYCPKPPNCNFSGKFGKAKLCINRLPLPDHSGWYVAAVGCIPYWENCDKCMCGDMKNGHCKLNLKSSPDDDDVRVDCNNLHKVSMSGVTYTL